MRIAIYGILMAVVVGIFITLIVTLITGNADTKLFLLQTIVTGIIVPFMKMFMDKLL